MRPGASPAEKFLKKARMRLIKFLLAMPVRLYQILLSPLLPRTCRFHPTCSAYALQAIHDYSAPKALFFIARRILRCHPFHLGGDDPLPQPDGRR